MAYIIKQFENFKQHQDDNYLEDLIFKNWDIFKNNYTSYNARIKSGMIAKFYLREFVNLFDMAMLDSMENWQQFTDSIHSEWYKKVPDTTLVFRGGRMNDTENFFSDDIKVAAVYSNILNAAMVSFQKPLVVDAKEESWLDIPVPEELQYDAAVLSTDEIVHLAKQSGGYDGVIIKDVFEGSGASAISTVYIPFHKTQFVQLTNN
jgi:hypothetical protein